MELDYQPISYNLIMPDQYHSRLAERLQNDTSWTSTDMTGGFIAMAYNIEHEVSFGSVASKIAVIFVHHQILHELLIDQIKLSILYVQAKVWPVAYEPVFDRGKDRTTGWYIEYFKDNNIKFAFKDEFVAKLERLNTLRNKVAHKLKDKNETIISASYDEFEALFDEASSLADSCETELRRLINEHIQTIDFRQLTEV
jgi:hypothetical protein